MIMTTIGHRTIDWQNFFANDIRQIRPFSPPAVFVPTSGWSGASFWKWRAEDGEFLLKIWPAEGPEARQHLFRHSQLNNLRNITLPLALPVPDQTGRTLRPWSDGLWAEVIPWFEGEPATVNPEVKQVDEVVQVLCDLHQRWTETTPSRTGPSSTVINRLNQLRIFDLSRLMGSRADFLGKGMNLPGESMNKLWEICRLAQSLRVDAVRLLQTFENEKFRILTVLRDARPDQFLFSGGKLSGVIDFGAVGRDIIAVDLSRLATEWYP
ncbi:MAG: phosphotransferase, partial [bacterium]